MAARHSAAFCCKKEGKKKDRGGVVGGQDKTGDMNPEADISSRLQR